jgi:SAM-dependent methyltransferase
MTAEELSLKHGFSSVDAQPDSSMLIDGMGSTARWPAVVALRAWESERLALKPGERLLDVGCGTGDVIVAHARALGAHGQAVGVDMSAEMVVEAQRRATKAGARVEFHQGDATDLARYGAGFDAARSERTLQWVPDPAGAFSGIVAAVRPGGRVAVIDTDWRTLVMDHPDRAANRKVNVALEQLRASSFDAGGRLVNLGRDCGLQDIAVTAETHIWTQWDPDASPMPEGFFPMRAGIDQLAAMGLLKQDEASRFIDQLEDAGRRGRFFMSLTMMAVYGVVPSS